MRPKGVVVYRSPVNPIAEAAKRNQKQKQLQRQDRAAPRAARPVPNYICYPQAFKNYDPKTGKWIGGRRGRLPKCRVCECTLHPEENHKCEGFKPKYVEHDQEWHERQDARREEIREAKHQRETPTCNLCGAELPTEEDYWAHGSECPML
jgi:hypothetical protein